jgi:hypothetical protein
MAIPVIFERRTTRRVAATVTRARLNAGIDVVVVDLSLEGVAIESELALAAGQEATLELRHPTLSESVSVEVRAVWCRLMPGKKRPTVGMLFKTVSVAQRNLLRRFVAAEAGSCVVVGDEAIGFLVNTAEGMWSVFGASASKIAYINREGPGRYKVCTGVGQDPRLAPRYHQAPTLLRAVSAACMRTSPRLEPPVRSEDGAPPPPPAAGRAAPAKAVKREPKPEPKPERELQPWEAWAATRKDAAKSSHHHEEEAETQGATLYGSCVKSKGAVLGYVALTGADVWSLYDADMNQTGVLSKTKSGYMVYWLGATAESSMAFVSADTFPGAIAVAFEIDELPGLASAPITAQSQTKTAPNPSARNAWGGGSRVVFRRRLMGYVVESAIDDTWAVFNKSMEQIAILARDSFPPHKFRAVFMGSSVEESMEYFIHETFVGAVAGTLSLPGVPLIDPPLEIADPS